MKVFPLYGALDIGSNAARILFANVLTHQNELIVFKNSLLRLPLRLGEDVYEKDRISPKKISALINTLHVFQSLIHIYEPLDYAVYATAAIREASNSKQILGLIKAETGFSINVIDGLEEARIIKELYDGKGSPDAYKLFADLGGGSLELTVLSPSGDYVSGSFRIGAVRALTKGISAEETLAMKNWLDSHLPKNRETLYFIGTGGNMNTLKSTFTSPLTSTIKLSVLKDIYHKLHPLELSQRISLYKLRPDRADVVIPAIEIFVDIMEHIAVSEIHVFGGGLSDGIVLELHKKHNIDQDKTLKSHNTNE
jgi:exopolyphosphatase / guanosine-5'-triphosphate,3'-diphosphate pyrophosphatase